MMTTEERLNSTQIEIAAKSRTVGEFQRVFKQEAMDVMAEGGDAEIVQSRIDVIAEATKDQAHLAMAATEQNVLGYAQVGGGDGSIVLSEQMFGTITTLDDAAQAQHTGRHEEQHVKQKKIGDLVFQDDVVTSWQSFEGDAELVANVHMAMAGTEHREGQPEDYAAAQNVVYAMQQVVGQEFWNTVLTETGDTEALQAKLDEAGVGRSTVATIDRMPR